MNGKSVRISRELFRKLMQRLFRHYRWDFVGRVVAAADVFVPIRGKPAQGGRFFHLGSFVIGFIDVRAVARLHLTGIDLRYSHGRWERAGAWINPPKSGRYAVRAM